MENQKDKKKKKVLMPFGLRNKLIAAISMLLVSSIMMVSSTYAWFTLSTAPEVKGISTSVGANGNLEMALLTSGTDENTNTFENLDKIASAVGNSYQTAGGNLGAANLTWGNLVDLSYSKDNTHNFYGLDQIKLLPARLNVKNAGGVLAIDKNELANLLLTPKYGDDGRVTTVTGTTLNSAKYEAANGKFVSETTASYGVRAIGESADLTEQEAGLMAAKTAYNKNLSEAKALVRDAMTKAGTNEGDPSNLQLFTNGIIALATDKDLSVEQQAVIKDLVYAVNGALDKVDAAYGEVLKAYAASVTADATTYKAFTAEVSALTTYTQIKAKLTENNIDTAKLPAELTTAYATFEQRKTEAQAAKDEVDKETGANYKTALNHLITVDEVLVNGLSPKKDVENSLFKQKKGSTDQYEPDVNRVLNSMKEYGGGVVVELPDSSGVVAYIGKVAGNYSATGVVDVDVNYGDHSMTMNDVNTTIKTTATPDATVNTAISNLKAATATGATTYITNTYGYAVDLAFRTNAANSKLLLQSDGIQRIYDATETSNTLTQGAGSTMTFKKATGVELNDTSIEKLMGAIRVVFFDPKEGTIYGIAALKDFNTSGEEYTGKLALMDATVNDGVMKLTEKTGDDAVTKATLMDLPQNTATRLSVLVYLDGDTVDNSMVANANESITGSLNLQFKSSATLVPMKNAELMKGTTATNP